MSQIATLIITQVIPYIMSPGLSTKHPSSAMPFLMVLETLLPMSRAPKNSKTAASMTACLTVIALEPTEVAYAFATAFAPMPKAAKKAQMPAAMM